MSAITAKASRKMKKYAVLTREPRCFLGSFDFSWEQRKLGDVVKEITRNDPESEAPIMMITANNGFIEQSERYAFNNAGESLKKYILLKKGELAYNHGASKLRPYGSCFALTTAENARIPFVYHCFSAENQNAEFMSIELNGAEIENQLRKIVSSGARMDGLLNISFDEYTSVSVLLPGTEEQDRIADFFRHLDNLITLHQRKCVFLFGFFQAFISMIFTASTFSWEQRKFSDVVATRRGLTYKPSDIRKNGVRVLRSSNIAEDSFVLSDEDVFVVREAVNIDCVRANDILITAANGSSRLVGKHTIISGIPEESAVHGGFMLLGTTKEPHFVNASMGSSWYRRFIELFVAGGNGAIGNLNKNDLDNQDIAIPSEKEQKKIGSFFRQLDNLITLHQRECISFTARAGRRILTANKKRNTSSWEQRKVQGVADRFDNLRIPVAANLRVHGTTPYYGANGIQDYVEGFTHDGEFVLVAEDGANDLKNYPVKCVNGRIWVNNHAHVLQGKAGIADNSFLAFAISQSDIESLLVGGGRAKLNAETLMSIEFRLPCLQEQYRIGEYLTQLNHLITLHQRKPFLMKWRTSDANRNQTNRLVL